MRDYIIKNYDLEDLDYALEKVESLYEIQFYPNELRHIKTLGELIDKVIFKIDNDHSVNCITQRAFYKLRNAISSSLSVDRNIISPKTRWEDLFSHNERIDSVLKIEHEIGYGLSLLKLPQYIICILVSLFFLAIYLLNTHLVYGMLTSVIFLMCLMLSTFLRTIQASETIGDIAERIAQKYYLQPKRKYEPIDKVEVEKALMRLFREQCGF